jgi:hypothetical protein
MPDYSLFGDEHVRRYEATGGKICHDWNNTSCLVLHTIGRKSGDTKKFPLIYGRDGNNYCCRLPTTCATAPPTCSPRSMLNHDA